MSACVFFVLLECFGTVCLVAFSMRILHADNRETCDLQSRILDFISTENYSVHRHSSYTEKFPDIHIMTTPKFCSFTEKSRMQDCVVNRFQINFTVQSVLGFFQVFHQVEVKCRKDQQLPTRRQLIGCVFTRHM